MIQNECYCDLYDKPDGRDINWKFLGTSRKSYSKLSRHQVYLHTIDKKSPFEIEKTSKSETKPPQTPPWYTDLSSLVTMRSTEGLLSYHSIFEDISHILLVSESFDHTLTKHRSAIQSSEYDIIRIANQLLTGIIKLDKAGVRRYNLNPDLIVVEKYGNRWHAKMSVYGDLCLLMASKSNTNSVNSDHSVNMAFQVSNLIYYMATGDNYGPNTKTSTVSSLSTPTKDLILGILKSPSSKDIYKLRQHMLDTLGGKPLAIDSNTLQSTLGSTYTGTVDDAYRHGKGEYICADGNKLAGDWRFGKLHGDATISLTDRSRYIGTVENGRYHGTGEYRFDNGDVYVGAFDRDRYRGHGKFVYHTGYVYEGMFENDGPSGEGTLRMQDKIIYRGQWRNGVYNGIGLKSYANGDVYEGNFNLGNKEGSGEYKFLDGSTYKGTYKLGRKSGDKCELVHYIGTIYKGPFEAGLKSGKGEFEFPDGRVYIGDFKADHFHGKGKLTWKIDNQANTKHSFGHEESFGSPASKSKAGSWTYEGDWIRGQPHGDGVHTYADGSIYTGNFVDGKRRGRGKLVTYRKEIFDGEWMNDLPNGKGDMIYASGETYTGGWYDGNKNGKGFLKNSDGEEYKGEFMNNIYQGRGKLKMLNGIVYEGEFNQGCIEGHGTLKFNKTSYYQGDFKDSKFDGYGQFLDSEGVMSEGNWKQSQRNGLVKTIYKDGRYEEGYYKHDRLHGTLMMRDKDGQETIAKYISGLKVKNSEKRVSIEGK